MAGRSIAAGTLLARGGLALALLAGAAVLLAGPAARAGLWHFRTGFLAMRWGAYAALGALALALGALALRGPRRTAAAALLAAALAFTGPWLWMRHARSVPPIHDISTDTEDPPAFVDVLPLRAGAGNPPAYAGAEVARQQREAYPDVQPLRLAVPAAEAFARAARAARELGWEMVAEAPQEGRIEATDTTRWFGFKDDVVIRVRPDGTGSRIDVRSKSRVGRSDVGANAHRIRRFLDRLRRAG